ncbi:MAG TPA: hypothetical protein VNH22_10120 [Blastocatellia bacterium]|jgi:hypothetical protein|nr:hypothetical protein [Blastocatellia bacterium]
MKKLTAFFRKPDVVMSVIFFTILIWGANARPTGQVSDQPERLRITNSVPGFELLSFERVGRDIKLLFKNNYSKNITSYALLMGKNAKVIQCLIYSEPDWSLPPGVDHEYTLTMPRSLNGKQENSLTIAAVVFDDRTGEGDAKIIHEIMEERLGKKVQTARALSVFKEFLKLPDTHLDPASPDKLYREAEVVLRPSDDDILETLSRMKPASISVHKEPGKELPHWFQFGIQGGYDSVLSDLRSLNELAESEKSGKALREKLIKIKDRYEKLIERL